MQTDNLCKCIFAGIANVDFAIKSLMDLHVARGIPLRSTANLTIKLAPKLAAAMTS
jgi:hypothetical protein